MILIVYHLPPWQRLIQVIFSNFFCNLWKNAIEIILNFSPEIVLNLEHHGMKAELTLEWGMEVSPRMKIRIVILQLSQLFHQQGMQMLMDSRAVPKIIESVRYYSLKTKG